MGPVFLFFIYYFALIKTINSKSNNYEKIQSFSVVASPLATQLLTSNNCSSQWLLFCFPLFVGRLYSSFERDRALIVNYLLAVGWLHFEELLYRVPVSLMRSPEIWQIYRNIPYTSQVTITMFRAFAHGSDPIHFRAITFVSIETAA